MQILREDTVAGLLDPVGPASVGGPGADADAAGADQFACDGVPGGQPDRVHARRRGQNRRDQPGAANQPLFVTLYPRLKDIPTPFDTGLTTVNTEGLLTALPDVVLVSPTSQALLSSLENTGIPTVVIAAFTNPDQIKAGMSFIADVLGGDAPARAQHFASYYDGNVARVQAVTASIPQASRTDGLLQRGDPLITEAQGSIVTTWVDQAGARNSAAENGVSGVLVPVTLEAVIGWNPDFIICRDASTRPKILQDPQWQNVAAVRNNRVLVQHRYLEPFESIGVGLNQPSYSRIHGSTSNLARSRRTFSASWIRARVSVMVLIGGLCPEICIQRQAVNWLNSLGVNSIAAAVQSSQRGRLAADRRLGTLTAAPRNKTDTCTSGASWARLSGSSAGHGPAGGRACRHVACVDPAAVRDCVYAPGRPAVTGATRTSASQSRNASQSAGTRVR